MADENLAQRTADSTVETIQKLFAEGGAKAIEEYLESKIADLSTVHATVDALSPKEVREFEVLLTFGGPNTWLHLGGSKDNTFVQVYWGMSEWKTYINSDEIAETMYEYVEGLYLLELAMLK